jgi:hypothetical protein
MMRFYQLKITLMGTDPAVWRRIVVPASLSLDRLHDVIQVVMGWEDAHLHEFIFQARRFSEAIDSMDPMENIEDESRHRLNELLTRKGQRLIYVYDFGDSWEHDILLENSRYQDPEQFMAVMCLGGERACPPEDIGGIPGYEALCAAMGDASNPQRQDYIDWLGEPFDAEAFDLEVVQRRLYHYLRHSRDRTIQWNMPTPWVI